ncbi:MAG: hypothetical protein MJ197_07750 [Bacteroidales bacterium]|nr:hypothetical protein [Bacteroidales bacterium]
MAKKNWFIEANKSQDPEVKDLLAQYNVLDANAADFEAKRAEISLKIKVILGLAEAAEVKETESPAENVQPEAETGAENVQIDSDIAEIDAELDNSEKDNSQDEPVADSESECAKNAQNEIPAEKPVKDEAPSVFSYTETDAMKAKDLDTLILIKKACREEVARLENTRLKHATYKQNRELDAEIWKIQRIIGIAFKREVALKQRAKQIRNAGRVSSIALKRARFVKLMRQGISITNITKHPEGVKKEELIAVLDKDTIEACKKNNSRFPDMWERWKLKFLDNKETKKQ